MGFGGGNGFSPSRTIVEDSTKTGNDAGQKHQFTGSVEISGGPLKLNGASITGGGGGTPGGSDTQFQYNNGGAFGGASGLIYDDANNRVGIGVADPETPLEIRSTTTQQKWSYDDDHEFTVSVADNGETVLAVSGTTTAGLGASDLVLDVSKGGDIFFRRSGDRLRFGISTGDTFIQTDNQNSDMSFRVHPDGGLGAVGTEIARFDASGAGALLMSGTISVPGGDAPINFRDTATNIHSPGANRLALTAPKLEVTGALEVLSTSTQAKFSYDADSFATLTVADDSVTTLASGESGDIKIDAAGDIFLEADGGQIYMGDPGGDTKLKFDVQATTAFIDLLQNAPIVFSLGAGGASEIARFDQATDSFRLATDSPVQFRDTATQINSPSANVLTLTGPTVDVAGTFSLNSSNVTSTAPELNLLDASTVTAPAEGVWAGVERVAVLDIGASEYSVAAHTLGVTIPDKAIITRAILDVGTAFTSAGTPTLGLQTTGNIFPEPGSAAAQIDFFSNLGGSSNVPFALLAAQYSMDLTFSGGKLNGASTVTFTVAGANPLTAGAAKVYIYYIMGS